MIMMIMMGDVSSEPCGSDYQTPSVHGASSVFGSAGLLLGKAE